MTKSNILLAALASTASAARLFATTFSPAKDVPGSVVTLEFTPGDDEDSGKLEGNFESKECGLQPTWLDMTKKGVIYCLDEAWDDTDKGFIHTLSINEDGSLNHVGELETLPGPVASQFFNKDAAVAVANIAGSGITTYAVSADNKLTKLDTFTFETTAPTGAGVRPDQTFSKPHQAVLDPSGKVLVFPDLGYDVVRIFKIDPTTSKLTEKDPLRVAIDGENNHVRGDGPRHAVFWKEGDETYLFVIMELSNKVVSYKVTYEGDDVTFVEEDSQSIFLYEPHFKADDPKVELARGSEIVVSPDNKFIMTSNRLALVSTAPNPDKDNTTHPEIPSDTLSVFLPSAGGKLAPVQLAPSGGSFPRHFSISKDGKYVAVGNQLSYSVDIWERDTTTGMLGKRIASHFEMPGPVSSVFWCED